MNGKIPALLTLLLIVFISCEEPTANVRLDFSFTVDDQSLQRDTCQYLNAAGNLYGVSEVQFFISDVRLLHSDGNVVSLQNADAHYVDADIANTLSWLSMDKIPTGEYTELSFVFGLTPALNQTYHFPNPPENAMSWPANLGGGYHYMKINGWWINPEGIRCLFNLHTGTGQQYGNDGNFLGFVDNTFRVNIPLDNFVVSKNSTATIPLTMDINRWFDSPNLFDFNVFGGSIMQNQQAQEILKLNGPHVFYVHF